MMRQGVSMLRASAAMARVGVSALPRMSTAVSVARASKAAAGSRHASFLLGRNGLQASRRSVPAQSRGMAAEAAAAVFDLSGGEPTLTALALLFLLFATEKMTSKGKKDEEEKETEKAAAAAASAPAAQAPVPAPETRVQKVVDFGKEKAIKLSEKAHELKMKADADAAQVVGAIKAAGKDVDEHGRKLLKDAKESADALAARAEARLADAVAAGKEAAEKANAEGEKLAAGAVEAIHKAQLESDRLAKEAKVAASTAAEKLSRQAEEAAAQAAAAAAEARRQAERALDKARTDIPMPEHDFVDRMERAAGALSALSTQIDPMPHFLAATACASAGMNAHYAGKTRAGLVMGLAGVAFLGSASLIGFGPDKSVKEMREGYDLGTIGALLLCTATLPNMFASSVFTLMSGLGMISLAANGAKSYQMRGGDIHEPRFE